MRILYWVDAFPPHIGGAEVLSGQFVRALERNGHRIVVVTSRGRPGLPDQTDFFGIAVHRFSFYDALLKRDLRQIAALRSRASQIQETFQPDVIHRNFCTASSFFHLIAERTEHVPSLLTIHSVLPRGSGENSLHAQILRSVDWVVGVSDAMVQDARWLVPEITPRSSVIYNALEMPDLDPAPLSFDSPRILCASRLVADKGIDLAIDAFAAVTRRFPKARLVIAGDGPAKQALEQQANELGIQAKVDFAGWVDPEKIPSLINSSTIVAMPSRWEEPFGLVALQAAQMARPILATRVGGLPEVILHEQTGLLIEKDDSPALAKAMILLLEQPETAARMGQAGRKRVQEYFTMDRLVDEYQTLYRNLVARFDD